MKIWILSSPPFLKDFEKIVEYWPADSDVIITPVANFSVTPSGIRSLLATYKEVAPDVILTDHGHPAFFVMLVKKLFGAFKTPIYLFLRGNYWLESKSYGAKANRKIIFNLLIKAPREKEISLIGPDGYRYFYYSATTKGPDKTYRINNIFPALYTLLITSKDGSTTKEKLNFPFNGKLGENIQITTETYLDIMPPLAQFKEDLRLFVFKAGWSRLISVATKIVPVCEYLAREAKKHTNTPVVVCPIGVEEIDCSSLKDLELKHPSVCLIQNHQIKDKAQALVDFVDVVKNLPDVHFYISRGLPENRNNQNYLNVINAYQNLSNVEFVDIDGSNKYDYLNSTDIYALVSGLDCTPATIIEAGMVGKPVVASAVGGVPEMIVNGETGWAIDNKDDDVWISRINELSINKGLRHKMGQAHYKNVVENYSLDKISNQLLGIITSE